MLGPSGCGKSSILYAVAGFIRPTEGLVLIDGTEVIEPSADCGVMFQSHKLFPWKTVEENIAIGPRMRGSSNIEARRISRALIHRVGLKGFELAHISELSGGMTQRVNLARTLAADPKVILLDEPFASLDSQTRIDMQELLLSIWENSRKTVLLVTHDIDEALLLADRILLLSSRPGSVVGRFLVPYARPRSTSLLSSGQVLELKSKLFTLLRSEQRKTTENRR